MTLKDTEIYISFAFRNIELGKLQNLNASHFGSYENYARLFENQSNYQNKMIQNQNDQKSTYTLSAKPSWLDKPSFAYKILPFYG